MSRVYSMFISAECGVTMLITLAHHLRDVTLRHSDICVVGAWLENIASRNQCQLFGTVIELPCSASTLGLKWLRPLWEFTLSMHDDACRSNGFQFVALSFSSVVNFSEDVTGYDNAHRTPQLTYYVRLPQIQIQILISEILAECLAGIRSSVLPHLWASHIFSSGGRQMLWKAQYAAFQATSSRCFKHSFCHSLSWDCSLLWSLGVRHHSSVQVSKCFSSLHIANR